MLIAPRCGATGAYRTVRRGATALLVALAAGLAAASPSAAALWTTAGNISEEGQSAHTPHVAVDSAGEATAVWTRSNGKNDVVQAALEPAGGAPWGKPATLSEPGQEATEPQIAVDSAGDAIAVWTRSNGKNNVVQAAVRPAGEPWGEPVTVSEPGQDASQPHLGMDAAGDAALVWLRSNGSNVLVQAAVKRAGKPWGAPATLSEAGEDASGPRVALDGAGNAIAVWARSDGGDALVQSAMKPTGEAPWGKPATVSEPGQEASEPEVAVDAAGDATAVWSRYNGLKENGGSKYDAQTAYKPAGKPWEAPTRLSEEAGEETLEAKVAMSSAGEVTAVWKRFIYGCCRLIETASKPAGKTWSSPSSWEDGGDPQIAVNAAGDAAAAWTRYYGPGDLVRVAVKPAGEPWGKPATVSEDESAAPAVAMDDASHVTAVWTRYIGFGFGNFIVQAARYAPAKSYTIETAQKLSDEPAYTKAEINGEAGDTVDYAITVKNTGSTSLRFGALKDAACEGISPAGPTELESLAEETFTCTHKLDAFVRYSDEASIEGDEGTGLKTSNRVTVALAPVFEVHAGTADSSTGTCAEARTAVYTCSNLRAALAHAAAAPGSTVKLEHGVYQLGEAHGYPPGGHAFLEIVAGVTIQGAGPGATTIEQTDGRDPVIVIPYSASFEKIGIESVKITGGVADGEDGGEFFGWEKGGGGLRILGSGSEASSVTLTNDTLTGNLAHAQNAKGGAIFNKRTLNVIDSTIDDNTALATGAGSNTELGEADGGGIFNLGHLLIYGSTIADNTVQAGGVNSKAQGGGVNSGVENFTSEATAAIANSTITGNVASAGTTKNPPLVYGGGLAIDNGALNHVTVYGNTASPDNAWESWAGNIYEPQYGGGAWVNNSIVADGSATEGPNCVFQGFSPYPENNRNNLLEGPGGECAITSEYDPLTNADPQLLALADNGGPTETLALRPGSPAIDGASGCEGEFGERGSGWTTALVPLDVDQRGMPREGHCDIGAFQAERPFATAPPAIRGTPEPGDELTCLPGTWAGDGTLTYGYQWLRNGIPTGDATTAYAVTTADLESRISCLLTVTGTYGATETVSAPVDILPSPPMAATGTATAITPTTATLNATVSPGGGATTKCEFRWGTTESYGRSAPCASLPGPGASPVAVSAAIAGLTPNTGYHFRVIATNAGGTGGGADETFTTGRATSLPPPETKVPPHETHEEPAPPPKTDVLGTKEASPDATLASTSLTEGADGGVIVEIRCPAGTGGCAGTITLRTLTAVSSAGSRRGAKHKPRVLMIATASFTVAGGHTTRVKLRLSSKARALLAHRALRVRATIVATNAGGAVHTTLSTVTIHATKARQHASGGVKGARG